MVVARLAEWHERHELAVEATRRVRRLPSQVWIETASTLSRLPAGLAVPVSVVAKLLFEIFPEEPLVLSPGGHQRLIRNLGESPVRGGAIYDALVATTARENQATLLSLDGRAAATYRHIGVEVDWLVDD